MSEFTDRDRAILWARQMMAQEFVVLDTETTGLDSDAEAVQIGIVNKAGEILFDSLIRPRRPIPAEATRLHGITDETVQAAPGFFYILPQLHALLEGQTVLVYNADYDKRILLQSAHACGINWEAPWFAPHDWSGVGKEHHPNQDRWHCVMEWFAQFYGDWNDYHQSYKWQKLSVAALVMGIQVQNAHSAAGDALMTLGVVEGIAKRQTNDEAGFEDA